MADYYQILSQKISDTKDDPVRIRGVIYEAARLALKRQVFAQQPPMLPAEAAAHLRDLENAIKRLEADTRKAEETERGKCEEAATPAAANLPDPIAVPEPVPAPIAAPALSPPALAQVNPEPAEATPIAPAIVPAIAPDPPAPSEAEALQARRMRALENALLSERPGASNGAQRGERHEESKALPSSTKRRPERTGRAERPPRRTRDVKDNPAGKVPEAIEPPTSAATPQNAVATSPREMVERVLSQRPAPSRANPRDFVGSNAAHHGVQPRLQARPLLIAFAAVFQLAFAALASVSFYIAMWGRSAPVQTVENSPPAVKASSADVKAGQFEAAAVAAAPIGTSDPKPVQAAPVETAIVEAVPVQPAPSETAPLDAPRVEANAGAITRFETAASARAVETSQVESPPVEIASIAIPPSEKTPAAKAPVASVPAGKAPPVNISAATAPVANMPAAPAPALKPPGAMAAVGTTQPVASAVPALPFPQPPGYGVYAFQNNVLTELQKAPAVPVDPRASMALKIVAPSSTTVAATDLAFVLYRRGLAASAPQQVTVRIAARLAQSMNFDSLGRAVVAKPPTSTWIIRDQGYDLKVSPIRENADMLMLRPMAKEPALLPGRYELVIDGEPYDFIIAGEVTDPAHCVEGIATIRGPEFTECKSL